MVCPFTLLVTGGRAATLTYYGQGETTIGPDTLAHTVYHQGTTSTGEPFVLTLSFGTSQQLACGSHTCPLSAVRCGEGV